MGRPDSDIKISELNDRLRDSNLSDSEKGQIYHELSLLHTKNGSNLRAMYSSWRAKGAYTRAEDYTSLAKLYEDKGDLKSAAELWQEIAYSLNRDPFGKYTGRPEREKSLPDVVNALAKSVSLFRKAGYTEDKLEPNSHAFYAFKSYRELKKELEDMANPEVRKKILDNRKKRLENTTIDDDDDRHWREVRTTGGVWNLILLFLGITLIGFLFFTNFTGSSINNYGRSNPNIPSIINFNSLGIILGVLILTFIAINFLFSSKPIKKISKKDLRVIKNLPHKTRR